MSEDCLLRFPFLFYALYILLLCVHKEVARNAPALHAGPLAFFYEKSLAKKLFICLGSSFSRLLLLLVRCSRLGSSMFCDRCVYRYFLWIANCEFPYMKTSSQNAKFLLTPSKPQDKLTILYYNKKLDIVEIEGDDYVRNLLF